MARRRIGDLLQNYPFWLLDVAPSARVPFLVLGGPAFGFSAISHPEITVETEPIVQLNSAYPEHAFTGATISPLTLTRGARFYDSSMFTWIDRFIQGEDVPHRDLLLIQHMGLGVELGQGDAAAAVQSIIGPTFIEIIRVPGKAWMLWDAIPTRYTPGPGLDATSGEVTLSELDIQPVEIDEFSLDPTRILDSLSG